MKQFKIMEIHATMKQNNNLPRAQRSSGLRRVSMQTRTWREDRNSGSWCLHSAAAADEKEREEEEEDEEGKEELRSRRGEGSSGHFSTDVRNKKHRSHRPL